MNWTSKFKILSGLSIPISHKFASIRKIPTLKPPLATLLGGVVALADAAMQFKGEVRIKVQAIRSRIRHLAVLAVGLLLITCSESREVRVQRFLMRGNEMVRLKNFDEAERLFREAIGLDSCFADGWNNLGTLQFNRGDFVDAQISYTWALDCKPDFTDARFNRANAAYRLREWYSALSDLEKVDDVKPDTAASLHLRGLIYTGMQNYEQAAGTFKKLLSRHTDDFEALVNLGIVLYYAGKLDSAEDVIVHAIALNADEPNGYNTLALIETERGNFDKALEWVGKALALRPGDPYFLNNRGYIYLMTDRLPEAVSDIDKSMVSDPSNAWAHRNKGIYYYLKGDPDNAIRLLEQALGMDPSLPYAGEYMGLSYRSKGDEEAAGRWLDERRNSR